MDEKDLRYLNKAMLVALLMRGPAKVRYEVDPLDLTRAKGSSSRLRAAVLRAAAIDPSFGSACAKVCEAAREEEVERVRRWRRGSRVPCGAPVGGGAGSA